MDEELLSLIDKISSLPDDWHGAGTVGRSALLGIARHSASLGKIHHSAETGSGRTTLLFSHLSESHVVFARDDAGSVSQVRSSPLLKSDRVVFVEGATQKTLPNYNFECKFQIVLIDGPHGYPFPDLEYYYFYPLIKPGGLLLLDDTRIPSIGRMLEIIKAEDMFDLIEVVDDMAFLRRSDAPMIDPLGDSWWLQGYNRSRRLPFLRVLSKIAPRAIKRLLPRALKSQIRKRM